MSALNLSTLLTYYKNPEIQDRIVEHAQSKEVAVKFGDKGFGKRPDTLQFPSDVLELAKQGATSFHVSEEIWMNPLSIETGMKRKEIDAIRSGWDLVIDIDCDFLEYSALAGDLIIKALKHHGIRSVSVKFSGNHGFHIGVPFEAFPKMVHGKETRILFPEAPRKIALYLKDMIGKHLSKEILKKHDISRIAEMSGKDFRDLVIDGEFDAFQILEIDTLLISARHLYRMPYCFNEKSGLVSIPIDPDNILDFNKENARPEKVRPSDFIFLDRSKVRENEAEKLIVQAYDAKTDEKEISERLQQESGKQKYRDLDDLQDAVPEELFPPCIKIGLAGIKDGRKRFLFLLVNFLRSAGWDYDAIGERLHKWNKNNAEELREVLIKGQLRYHKQNKSNALPPNCDNNAYYKDIGICRPDGLCSRIRNPINYAKKRAFALRASEKKKREGLTEEQKAMRKRYREQKKKQKS
ncbi:hypothetical protein GF345_00945 [Candidatus Woesearchaeota archaeon]|nr:hypothetical protein [Candidatus Woesearchaeota archaeon]